MVTGKVYLVGAGPGDPELLTLKGAMCLAEAEVVVYDRLVDEQILQNVSASEEMIYVGKSADQHTLSQSEINQLLVDKAGEGKKVVRLKGGDPFLLGRGGEEAEALVQAAIPFEVVPGVSAATAVPAYAGIPVTHRSMASSMAVITGHEDPTKESSSIHWEKLATSVDTLVFLMGVGHLGQIAEELISNGRSAATPVAVIRNGTGPHQQTLVSTLGEVADEAAAAGFTPPAVIVVGDVVGLRDRIRWYDNQPLFGKAVLVTRSRQQASTLSRLLARHGALPVELPTIQIEALANSPEIDRAIARLPDYAWLIFTSVNGVDIFFDRLRQLGKDSRTLNGIKLCAIGPATAEALERHGLVVDLVPQEYRAEAIADSLQSIGIAGQNILLPRAEAAPPELVTRLTQLGARVDEIAVYRTVPPRGASGEGRQKLIAGEIDFTTFTSSSTVRHLVTLLGSEWEAVNRTKVACIGPVTAAAAADLGVRVDIVAGEHTIPGLVQAIIEDIQ
ncbi:MAG: uroporphyrinogen-III C-methyltransferase, partial [Dehalococcoidia bacterium]